MDKVVKLEDVEAFTNNSHDGSMGSRSTSNEEFRKTDLSVMEVEVVSPNSNTPNHEGEEVDLIESEKEVEDQLFALPENWLNKQIRPRSCELVNIWTPCLRKAVSHIKLLQKVIDEWLKQKDVQVSKQKTDKKTKKGNVGRRQLKFVPASDETLSDQSDAFKQVSADLAILGMSSHIAEEAEKIDSDISTPFLDAEGVFNEVLTLLANLENDRRETFEAYIKEVARTEMLQKKIDDLQLRWVKELPALVQREHETCIMDISELQWHYTYSERNKEKVQRRFATAEKINIHLKEDITFIQQHVPLVQEKLVLEVEAMDKIRKAQGDTDQELVMTKQRLAKTDMKYTEAITKAETERGFIKKELDRVRDDLANISQELSEAKLNFNAYVHQINDINSRLIDNEQEMKVLQVKNENAKIAEGMQATKVQNLQSKITQAVFEHRRLENENDQLEQDLKTTKNNNKHKIENLERQVQSVETKRRELTRKNQEVTMDIDDCEEKINKCIQHKVASEKNIVRINKEIERCSTMLQQTLESYNVNASLNHHLHGKLQIEKEQASQAEYKLKNTLEALRKQVKDEMHTKTVLQARITTEGGEIEKTKLESAKKREKAQNVADEVHRAVSAVLEKVEKLRSAKEERTKQKVSLQKKLEETESNFKENSEKLNKQLAVLQPHHQALKSQLKALNDEINQMEYKSSMMNKQIEEMDSAQKMMEKSVKTSEEAITTLTAELDELNVQVEAGRLLKEDLQNQYDESLERLQRSDKSHQTLMRERENVFRKHQSEKEHLKKKNNELASRYRQLQNEFLMAKDEMLKSFDDKVKIESTINDVKQLMSIQSKLHGALRIYIKLSGLYNEAELAKLHQESSNNSVRVSELQDNMEKALEEITQFLSSQRDGQRPSLARKETALDVKASQVQGHAVSLPQISESIVVKPTFTSTGQCHQATTAVL
ncbi:coiled-coil domain-containing protein 178 [Biomphalaria glabrata]|nr:coiled-coil domain-containing protein 178 [Biomphalaria glabrata]